MDLKSKTVFYSPSDFYGQISNDRKIIKLAELCVDEKGVLTGPFGTQLHQRDYVSSGIPIITVEHLGDNYIINENVPKVSNLDYERLSKYVLNVGDIVFSRVGSVDRSSIIRLPEKGWLFSGRCLRIRPNTEKIIPEYLSWFFQFSKFKEYIHRISVGAVMPSLNTKLIEDVDVIWTSLENQQKIAIVLNSFHYKIQNIRKQNKILEQTVNTIFMSWFVNFEGVTDWDGSELGTIPKGWKIKKLGEIIDSITDTVKATSDKDHEKYVALDDIQSKSLTLSQFSNGSKVNSSIIKFKHKDILFGNMRPYFHRVCVAPFNGITRKTTFVIRPKDDFLYSFSLLHLFSDELIAYCTNHSIGTSIPYVEWLSLSKYKIICPPVNILKKFEALIKPILNLLEKNSFEIFMLIETRDILLPKLMSGEIRV